LDKGCCLPDAMESRAIKKISRAVGILYILGTVFGMVSLALTNSILSSDDVLGSVNSHQTKLALGALAVLAMGLALAMIPVVAYPVLSRSSVLLARGYFLFRSVLETVGYLLTTIGWLVLIPLSSSTDVAKVWGDTLINSKGVAEVGTIVFLIGVSMFYLVLFRAKLVPRWLSSWGLLAAIPYLVPVLLGLFSTVDVSAGSTLGTVFEIPLALQEMVLAVWLIAKGFDGRRVAMQDQPGF
jgi:hypothetical protein